MYSGHQNPIGASKSGGSSGATHLEPPRPPPVRSSNSTLAAAKASLSPMGVPLRQALAVCGYPIEPSALLLAETHRLLQVGRELGVLVSVQHVVQIGRVVGAQLEKPSFTVRVAIHELR